MDNMLYIIAGLVLILLVAVVVLRKKKAQKTSVQSPIQANKNAANNVPLSTSAAIDTDDTRKFDSLAVAQRFMDQQRYDKAIETLKRGLIEKPNDSQLSLKLLSVYATIEQSDDFYEVYDRIKTHNDVATIKQADELKSFLVEEHNQAAARNAPVAETDSGDFESLDFDLPTTQTTENRASPAVATASERVDSFDDINDISPINSNMDDSFDLTLGDLETDNDLETDSDLETSGSDVNDLQPTAAEAIVTNIVPVSQSDNINDDDLNTDDFNFNFETPVQAATTQDVPVDTATESSSLEDISLNNDDFVLDFADLATDTDTDSGVGIESNTAIESPVQTSEDDFTLSLDGEYELNSDDELETEDKSLADVPAITEDTPLESSSVTPTMSSTFDENTLIDDGVFIGDNFDTTSSLPTETTPVEFKEDYGAGADISSGVEYSPESDIESTSDDVSAETPADFASRFAADFDFVKTLDSNQVTLDLASQYLQLGEYDSAKRLLNEVMTQGNDEQQNQAQALLDRTA